MKKNSKMYTFLLNLPSNAIEIFHSLGVMVGVCDKITVFRKIKSCLLQLMLKKDILDQLNPDFLTVH